MGPSIKMPNAFSVHSKLGNNCGDSLLTLVSIKTKGRALSSNELTLEPCSLLQNVPYNTEYATCWGATGATVILNGIPIDTASMKS